VGTARSRQRTVAGSLRELCKGCAPARGELRCSGLTHKEAGGGKGGAMDDDAPRFVEIGDEFALQTLPARGEDSEVVIGFVSAHGDIRVDFLDGKDMDFANPPRPHDCRFVLHPTNEYSASKMLRKGQGVAGTTEAEVVRLERAAELEKDRNDLDRETRQGHRIAFGSTCQLYSPGSDTYVEVEKRRAREDHFAQTASMVADGLATRTKHPWFRVMPGFATRTEGEYLRFGDIICA
jgi:hypothetical protein